MLPRSHLLALLILLAHTPILHPARPEKPADLTLGDLLARSPYIAVIEIRDPPPTPEPGDHLTIPRQTAQARLIHSVRGTLPPIFQIENEADSLLTPGHKLAFLRQLAPDRYILSTPISLRRIIGDQVYWFPHDEAPLIDILKQLKTIYPDTPSTADPLPPSAPKPLSPGTYRGYAENLTVHDDLLTTPLHQAAESDITLQVAYRGIHIGPDHYRFYDHDRLLAIRHLPDSTTQRLHIRAQCGPVTLIDLTTVTPEGKPTHLIRLTIAPIQIPP